MILLGCLLAMGIAVAPRAVLILAWIFSDRWTAVWQGQWLVPLLGIAFLPFTTVMYMLTWKPSGISGWDWLWILLGLFLDLSNYAQGAANRKQIPGYAAATAGVSGSSAVETVSPAAKPVTAPAPAAPAAPVSTPTPVGPATPPASAGEPTEPAAPSADDSAGDAPPA
jgi:hypothetical protein